MKKRLVRFSLIATLLLTGVVTVLTLVDRALMVRLFEHLSYYILGLMVFLWSMTLFQSLKASGFEIKNFVYSNRRAILFTFLTSLLVFISTKPYFRVLSDETNLVSVSQSMVYDQKPDNIIAGLRSETEFRPLKAAIPRRPLLFPFVLHLAHILTGYRAENAFGLNFLTFWILLMGAFLLIRRFLSNTWAYGTVFFIAAQPIVIESATSAGFDLFSTVFIFGGFVLLHSFLDSPNPLRFKMLWIHLLMLAHIRYESALFFAVIFSALFALKYLRFEYFKDSGVMALTPLVLLPLFWQRFLAEPPFQQLGETAAFSVDYFLNHSHAFFENLWVTKTALPLAPLLNACGVIAFTYFVFLLTSKRWPQEKHHRQFIFIFLACLIALWGITTTYYYGNVLRASCTRYYTLFYILLSVLSVLFLHRIRIFEKKPVHLIVAALLVFITYHTETLQGGFTNTVIITRTYRHVLGFLHKQPNQNFLLITNTPGQYTIYPYGAMLFSMANAQKEKLLDDLRKNPFREIFVVQEISPETWSPVSQEELQFHLEDTELDPEFKLKPVFELLNHAKAFLRISRVKIPEPR